MHWGKAFWEVVQIRKVSTFIRAGAILQRSGALATEKVGLDMSSFDTPIRVVSLLFAVSSFSMAFFEIPGEDSLLVTACYVALALILVGLWVLGRRARRAELEGGR